MLDACWRWIRKAYREVDGIVQLSCEGCKVQIDIYTRKTTVEDGSVEGWMLPTAASKKSIYAIPKIASVDFFRGEFHNQVDRKK
jgi:hypothetical protein